MSKNWLILLVFLAVAGGGLYYINRPKVVTNINSAEVLPVLPTQVIFPTETVVPTATPIIKKSVEKVMVEAGGALRGQVSCNYVLPATPNEYGTAVIDSNWNNANKKVEVNVSVNGGNNTIMATDTRTNGSRSDKASWIALNSNYTFSLIGDGVTLSSCQISQAFPTMAPTQVPGKR